jgi:hypothetical protein
MTMPQRPGEWTPNFHGDNVSDLFVKPGTDPLDLHFRTNLPNIKFAFIIARTEDRYNTFYQFNDLKKLRSIEALFTSNGGERIKELIDSLTGRDRDHKNPKGGVIQTVRQGIDSYRNPQNPTQSPQS